MIKRFSERLRFSPNCLERRSALGHRNLRSERKLAPDENLGNNEPRLPLERAKGRGGLPKSVFSEAGGCAQWGL